MYKAQWNYINGGNYIEIDAEYHQFQTQTWTPFTAEVEEVAKYETEAEDTENKIFPLTFDESAVPKTFCIPS